ncbi:hypothetical protein EGW08_002008 [Elysia chlorotica]|uniref:ABC transmembrane type-1 domain-containing protein n=1 Tax=Elysia chlorotica TaxID=188477 RepID=A0A3S1BKC9_ELYCH|nr:hypothetical protein EGW08_002008 [Elysia chlorotica]
MEEKNNIENVGADHHRPKVLDRQHLITDEAKTKYDGSNGAAPDATEEPQEEEEPPKTSLLAMFRFADGLDIVMLVAGTVCAMVNGFSWPFMLIVFADTIQDFVDFALYEKFLQKIPDFLERINITFDDAREDIGDFLPYCDMLLNYTTASGVNITCDDLETTDNLFDEMDDKVLIYLVGSAVVMVSAFGQVYLFIISAERQITRMRLAFYRAVVRQEMGWLDSRSPGELAVKLTDDIGKIHEAIGDKGATAIQFYTASLSSVVACFVFGWELTLILQIASPFIFTSFAAIGIVRIILLKL